MNRWKAIQEFVFSSIRDPATNLTALANKAGVSVWWLYRIKYRSDEVKDVGFMKTGAVFQALGGRAPKVPKQEQKNARSDDVSSQ
jgi:hypothetical protein